MTRLPFHKLFPEGNPTILIDNRERLISPEQYGFLGAALMSEPYLGGEQVGFIETPRSPDAQGRMVMMGGELCLNALRAYGLLLGLDGSDEAAATPFLVETSGAESMVEVTAAARGDAHDAEVVVRLPLRPQGRGLRAQHGPRYPDGFGTRLPGYSEEHADRYRSGERLPSGEVRHRYDRKSGRVDGRALAHGR